MAHRDFAVQGKVTLDTIRKDVKNVTFYPLARSQEHAKQRFEELCKQRFGDSILSIEIEFTNEYSY